MRKPTTILTAALLGAALLLAGCSSEPETGVKAIVGARLEPGRDLPALDYSVVVIANGKYRDVGPQSSTPVPKGAEIISGAGEIVEPLEGWEPIEKGREAYLTLKNATTGKPDRVMRKGERTP